jgi:hypothetical protein
MAANLKAGHLAALDQLDREADVAAVALAEGDALLREISAFLAEFIAYPSNHARVAHTLWIAHTHLMDAWESTPRIAFLSPEPGSGKTRALEVTELLVPRSVEAVNATPAYLFRKVSDPEGLPTILFDEIDTIFGPRAKENEEIRGMLNAGHRRGAMAGRCVVKGKTVVTEELPAYCAVALAGLGSLPDTILSRSIIIRMRRRAPDERVAPYRRRIHGPDGHSLRDQLAKWATHLKPTIGEQWPQMPPGIADRNADVWEPLLTIADAVGDPWPLIAREAAVALVADAMAASPSLGIRLLADLKTVFAAQESLSTKEAIDALTGLEEAPWADLKGKPLDARKLSNLLRPYGVAPVNVRSGNGVVKGYKRESLHDPWTRYLGVAAGGSSLLTNATNATPLQIDGIGFSPDSSATTATPATEGLYRAR